MANYLYFFNGSEGCDRCQALTGYYVEKPSRPHDHCDCFVERVEVGEILGVELKRVKHEHIRFDENQYVVPYKEFVVTQEMVDGPGLYFSTNHTFHNFINISPEMGKLYRVDSLYRKSFENQWSLHLKFAPSDISKVVNVDIVGIVDQAIFTAEKFLVYDGKNGPIKVSLGHIVEEMEIVVDSRLTKRGS